MIKINLYPPHLDGSIPPFTEDFVEIPYDDNRAVGSSDYDGLKARIKDIQANKTIAVLTFNRNDIINMGAGSKIIRLKQVSSLEVPDTPGYVPIGDVRFAAIREVLKRDQYYKLQLAYYKKQTDGQIGLGFWSDTTIFKYLKESPVLSIEDMRDDVPNIHQYAYRTKFDYKIKNADQYQDEKLYSTEFILKDVTSGQIWSSGEIIHNFDTDNNTVAGDDYTFLQDLIHDHHYTIQAIAKTINNFKIESPKYSLISAATIPTATDYRIVPRLDFENGGIEVYFESDHLITLYGKYKIVRADEKENYEIWHVMCESDLSDGSNGLWVTDSKVNLIWKDFTVEQGCKYKYAFFCMNDNNTISYKYISNEIYADFEDLFLFDGDKQLKVRFDPKVTSFKTIIQEAKTETLGSRYPIFQRNGYINYKEIPISGLISHLSDEDGYFDKGMAEVIRENNRALRQETPSYDSKRYQLYTTQHNSENIYAERKFKLEVLDWLNNGKPKLFRSPAEGNYLIRLLNVSLTPKDQLGRMLHTFSATGYEMDDESIETLTKYNIARNYNLFGISQIKNDIKTKTIFLGNYCNDLYFDKNILEQSTVFGEDFDSRIQVVKISYDIKNVDDNTSSSVYMYINGAATTVKDGNSSNYTIDSLYIPASEIEFEDHYSKAYATIYYIETEKEETDNIVSSVTVRPEISQYFGFNLQNLIGTSPYKYLRDVLYFEYGSLLNDNISEEKISRDITEDSDLEEILKSITIEGFLNLTKVILTLNVSSDKVVKDYSGQEIEKKDGVCKIYLYYNPQIERFSLQNNRDQKNVNGYNLYQKGDWVRVQNIDQKQIDINFYEFNNWLNKPFFSTDSDSFERFKPLWIQTKLDTNQEIISNFNDSINLKTSEFRKYKNFEGNELCYVNIVGLYNINKFVLFRRIRNTDLLYKYLFSNDNIINPNLKINMTENGLEKQFNLTLKEFKFLCAISEYTNTWDTDKGKYKNDWYSYISRFNQQRYVIGNRETTFQTILDKPNNIYIQNYYLPKQIIAGTFGIGVQENFVGEDCSYKKIEINEEDMAGEGV